MTIKNILKAVALRQMEEDPHFRAESFSWYYIKEMRRDGMVTIRQLMRPLGLYCIKHDKSVFSAARIFSRHGINYLPVTRDNRFVGMLNCQDFFYTHYEFTGLKSLKQVRPGKAAALQ